ncbi:MAG TPA: DUF1697 domain-containing protein [Devosiaceae bacterium]|nr:DUF1697 domain-containing protein [Devosiaceae bacterium]
MSRHAAFLRGVNLGKRQVKSAELKAVFESAGMRDVRTLLASGNVLFDTTDTAGLQQKLETALEEHFGFAIGVVLRTHEELQAMLAHEPFAAIPEGADAQFFVLLLAEPLTPPPQLQGVAGDHEIARIDPRDIYLVGYRRPNGRYSEGLEQIGKQLPKGLLCTMRNWNTIRKAAA